MKPMNPAYIRFKDIDEGNTFSHTVNVKNKGMLLVDIGKDGSILGVEILAGKYAVEINGKQIYPVKRKKK
jgi:uncharacterized protein YuzE